MTTLHDQVTVCRHCGKANPPLTSDGYIDRHYRADHRPGVDPGNQLCAGSAMGGGHLRPGEPCRHQPPSPHCVDASLTEVIE